MPIPEQIFGWSADPYDPQDEEYKFAPAVYAPGTDIKPVVYNITPRVKNQLQEGSCVFHAATEAMEAAEIMNNPPKQRPRLAPQFAYYHYREVEGDITVDSGANIRTAMKLMARDGVCAEALWPYSLDNFKTKPSEAAYQDAQGHKIAQYHAVDQDLADLLICLSSGRNIVCGISVFESFKSDACAQTGIIPLPGLREKFLGGHGILVHGHNVHQKVFICQNSWGTDWGCQPPTYPERGHFYLPFDYLTTGGLANSFWTVDLVTGAE